MWIRNFPIFLPRPIVNEVIKVCSNPFACIMQWWCASNRPKVEKGQIKREHIAQIKWKTLIQNTNTDVQLQKNVHFILLQSTGTGFSIQIPFFVSSPICMPFHRHFFRTTPIFNLISKSNYGFVCILDGNRRWCHSNISTAVEIVKRSNVRKKVSVQILNRCGSAFYYMIHWLYDSISMFFFLPPESAIVASFTGKYCVRKLKRHFPYGFSVLHGIRLDLHVDAFLCIWHRYARVVRRRRHPANEHAIIIELSDWQRYVNVNA